MSPVSFRPYLSHTAYSTLKYMPSNSSIQRAAPTSAFCSSCRAGRLQMRRMAVPKRFLRYKNVYRARKVYVRDVSIGLRERASPALDVSAGPAAGTDHQG